MPYGITEASKTGSHKAIDMIEDEAILSDENNDAVEILVGESELIEKHVMDYLSSESIYQLYP